MVVRIYALKPSPIRIRNQDKFRLESGLLAFAAVTYMDIMLPRLNLVCHGGVGMN